MKKRLLFLILLIFSNVSTVGAVTSKNTNAHEKEQAKAMMDRIYSSFLNIVPYLYSDESNLLELKNDKAKKDKLLQDLTDLSVFFNGASHIKYFNSPGLKPNLETMNSHLKETIYSVKNDNFLYAQKRLSSITALCINCHTQLSTSGASNAFGQALNSSKREEFKSDFDYGNYLYLIRQFDESEIYLLRSLESSLSGGNTSELYTSLRRIISLHTKIKYNYVSAKKFIDKYKVDPRMPKLAKDNLTDWGQAIEKWKGFNPDEVVDVDAFIKKHLSPLEELNEQNGAGVNDITLLISAGVLSKYLNDHKETKSAPQILYWLSIAEKRLSNTYFFTISDLYLKECIEKYSKSKIAKKCYGQYEENVNLGFTGSGGKDVPAEEIKELKRLKNKLR